MNESCCCIAFGGYWDDRAITEARIDNSLAADSEILGVSKVGIVGDDCGCFEIGWVDDWSVGGVKGRNRISGERVSSVVLVPWANFIEGPGDKAQH